MENITASEIVGELRRAARMYEVLKRAEEMAMVLVNLEGRERILKTSIVEATKELETIKQEVVVVVEELSKKEESTKLTVQKLREDAVEIKKQASEVFKKATEEAANLVANAKSEVEGMRSHISDLRKETDKAKVEVELAKASLASVFAEMKSKKEQLLKAFS